MKHLFHSDKNQNQYEDAYKNMDKDNIPVSNNFLEVNAINKNIIENEKVFIKDDKIIIQRNGENLSFDKKEWVNITNKINSIQENDNLKSYSNNRLLNEVKENREIKNLKKALDAESFKKAKKVGTSDEILDDDLYEILFDYYLENETMPYGIAKARTGDPNIWIADELKRIFN